MPFQDEVEELREAVSMLAGPMLDEAVPPTSPGELELLALDLIGPFGDPDEPPPLLSLLPDALEARKDELGAGMLAALAALGPPPLAGQAARARDRLESEGIGSPHANSVGALHVRACYRRSLGEGEAEALAALVGRDGDDHTQAAALMLEDEPCGGVIVEGLLTALNESDGGDSAYRMLELLDERSRPIETLSPAAMTRRVRAALRHMVEHELELTRESMVTLLVLERALTARNGRWPRPTVAPPDDELEDASDYEPDDLREEADDLLDAFVSGLEEDRPGDAELLQHGPDVAFLMTDWKIGHADGMLTRWTHEDLCTFLLDWYPRKGGSDDETLAAAPGAVVTFLRFLDQRRLLSGADIEALATTVESLRDRFEDKARDPRNWGPGKALVTQMRSEGVEPTDQAALDAWMADFNSRPSEERDLVLGPALESARAAGTRPRGRGNRRAKRKATRSPRRRNRS